MTNDFPSFYFTSHRSSASLGVGRASASALIPTTNELVQLVCRRLGRSELTVNWKPLSPSVPLGKPNQALAFPRPRLEDFTGKNESLARACDMLPTVSNFLSFHNHPQFYFTNEQWADLVTPVMSAQREHLLRGEDEALGNCVAALPGPNSSRCVGVVLHPNGDDMSNLNVSLLCSDCDSEEHESYHLGSDSENSLSSSEPEKSSASFKRLKCVTNQRHNLEWEIHQINCVEIEDRSAIGVRTDYGCCFFKGPSSNQVKEAYEMYTATYEDLDDGSTSFLLDFDLIEPLTALRSRCPLRHVCMSPHIFGEAAVSTAQEGLHLWSSQSGLQTVRTYDPIVVGYNEAWSQCCFAAHPRQIWMATRNCVEKIDCRMSKSSLQLLSSDRERVKNVSVLEPQLSQQFCVLFATDKHVALVDERFPSEALLLWDHGLRRPPHFMQVKTVYEGDSVAGHHHAVLLASSNPAETVILTYRDGVSLPVDVDSSLAILNGSNMIRLPAQGAGLDFPVGKYSDWPGEMNPPLLNSTVHKRLMAPLFGIQMIGAGTNNTAGIRTILQLSDQGDIFYQQLEYCMKSTDSYIQCTAYDGSTCWQEQLSEDIEEWILDVEQQERDQTERKYAEEVDKLGFGAASYAKSYRMEQRVKDFSHCYKYLESTTDLCYSCWTDLNKSHQPETNSEVAGQDNCEDMEASSHCQKCGFVFGRPCAVIQRHYLSTYLQCARTDKGLCNSFSGKKSISANVQHNLLKLTPKHRKRGSLYIPNEARKMEVDRFGCIDRSKVAVLSLVSKPDEKQSAFSRKLWEDWFEGEEPTLGVDQTGSVQQASDEQSSEISLLPLDKPPAKKVAKRKRKHKIGF